MKKAVFSIVIFSLLMISCTTTREATLNTSNEKLEIFVSLLPDKAYIEIAYIQCDGGIFNTPQQLLNGLKKKAVQLNADAIVKVEYDYQGIWPVASAIAIKYQ